MDLAFRAIFLFAFICLNRRMSMSAEGRKTSIAIEKYSIGSARDVPGAPEGLSEKAPMRSTTTARKAQALLTVARHADSRKCLVLLGAILENPGLAERLLQVLKPSAERRQSQ